MRYEVVRKLEKLQTLSAEWNGLVARSRSDFHQLATAIADKLAAK